MRRSAQRLLPRSTKTSSLTSPVTRSSYLPSHSPSLPTISHSQTRSLFGFSKKPTGQKPNPFAANNSFPAPPPQPLYGKDDLFHPLATSPIHQLKRKAALIKSLAPCPVCIDHNHTTASSPSSTTIDANESTTASDTTTLQARLANAKKVSHTCPDCGFPTHCSEEHWIEGKQAHQEFCSRLREINEDEHDLRSGRILSEFEMPGPQDYESTISFASWDTFLYTRNFSSIESDRPRRHVSKLLTYPVTIASVLHQIGSFAGGNTGRLSREGKRSMAALYTSLHPPIGATPSPDTRNAKVPIRIFIIGARAESSLPPHIYEQLCHLFPFTQFQIFFIGPQAALPANAALGPIAPAGPGEGEAGKKVYSPETPSQSSETVGKGHMETTQFGVPAYTISVSPYLTLTTLQSSYDTVHNVLGPFDPYTDVFFSFCPGFGFPSPTVPGTLQAETEWSETLRQVLETKCPLFVTGFSPRDVERDVKSLDKVKGVQGEYDVLLEPGENIFSSLKWEAGDFDPRVLVKVNWGVWGIRGKRYEVKTAVDEE